MSHPLRLHRAASTVIGLALLFSSCSSEGVSDTSDSVSDADRSEETAPAVSQPELVTETADTGAEPRAEGATYYLPTNLPEGFELEEVAFLEQSEAITLPPAVEAASVLIGDSDWSSESSLSLTAQRFGSPEELEQAKLIEDGMVVLNGGPEYGLTVGDSTFIYANLDGPGGALGGYFHAVVADTLVTGVLIGQVDPSSLSQVLSTIDVSTDGELRLIVDGAAASLTTTIWEDGVELPGFFDGYELTFGNGIDRFIVSVTPDSPEELLAGAQVFTEGERMTGEQGSGYLMSQPEVGAALGSRRLSWWVPTMRADIAYGQVVDDETAMAVVASFEEVSAETWARAVAELDTTTRVLGPETLPDDPQVKLDELVAETDRPDRERAIHELDIADMTEFIGELRGSEFPVEPVIEWTGPVELGLQTSGAILIPQNVEHAMAALRLFRRTSDPQEAARARQRDIRGLCCGLESITLVEGMEADEAAVIAAHELAHLFDSLVVQPSFRPSDELLNPASAVIEGNATRVMLAYRDERGLRYNPDRRPHLSMLAPAPVRRVLAFAYDDGARFVSAIVEAGGEEAVDAAFTTNPPLTTEHILHPESYLAGDLPVEVDRPAVPDEFEVEHQGTLGAFIVALSTLQELGWEESLELSSSWAGDSFVVWVDGQVPCIAVTILFDDAEAATLYVEETSAESAVAFNETVTVESCGW